MSVITLLEFSALLGFILLPLIPRRKKKPVKLTGLSALAVNEYGYLEPVSNNSGREHQLY